MPSFGALGKPGTNSTKGDAEQAHCQRMGTSFMRLRAHYICIMIYITACITYKCVRDNSTWNNVSITYLFAAFITYTMGKCILSFAGRPKCRYRTVNPRTSRRYGRHRGKQILRGRVSTQHIGDIVCTLHGDNYNSLCTWDNECMNLALPYNFDTPSSAGSLSQ